YGVRESPGVEMVADLANIFAVGCEFEELRRCRAIRGTGGVAAREHKNVSLGIDGHAGGFTEIQIVGKLEEIGSGIERNFRNGLLTECERRNHQATQKSECTTAH